MPLPPDMLHKHAADPGDLPEGIRLLDRYTILDRVGSGGMSTIYRAIDERLDRVVCVKLLRLVLEGSGSSAGRTIYRATYSHFLQEALALSKLQHPNTLRIYDFGYLDENLPTPQSGTSALAPQAGIVGSHPASGALGSHPASGALGSHPASGALGSHPASGAPGRPFQISEYLDAGNLERRVRRIGAIPRDEIERILEHMCGAIAEAHEHRIIHRDIKPSNILFARIGETLVPKLADFGIARTEITRQSRGGGDPFPHEDDAGSISTVALFSPRWAAPEQLCGAPEGPYTDVYALGLLTMFMLTGRAPFDDKDVRSTFNARVRSDAIIEERVRDRIVDGPLAAMLKAAMTADPSARIPSAMELFARVKTALAAPAVGPASTRQPVPSPIPVASSTVSVELEAVTGDDPIPAERAEDVGGYRVRLVQVMEVLDFTRANPAGTELRFRVTMLPGSPLRINVKGLNCFVAFADGGGKPTPAIVSGQDGAVDLISAQREKLGRVSWSFGRSTHVGRVFLVDGKELVVPYSEATHAVVVHFGNDRELVAMCQRA